MKKELSISLVVVSCLFFINAVFAAPPSKSSIPNLVGAWATEGYADGRIYEYPVSCAVITSQNGNLLGGTFYWWDSVKLIDNTAICFDPWDPVSCPSGKVKEYYEDYNGTGAHYGLLQADFTGSINSNQVILQGSGSITRTYNGTNYVAELKRTSIGLYDQNSDTINGVAHLSIVTKINSLSLYSASNETRGFKMYRGGVQCPPTEPPTSPITWVGH